MSSCPTNRPNGFEDSERYPCFLIEPVAPISMLAIGSPGFARASDSQVRQRIDRLAHEQSDLWM